MRNDPTLTLATILVIGIVAGLIFDRIAGPGWLTRQIAGSTRGMVTSSLVGIAGAFTGYHLAALVVRDHTAYLGAIAGAAVVLWVWRIMR